MRQAEGAAGLEEFTTEPFNGKPGRLGVRGFGVKTYDKSKAIQFANQFSGTVYLFKSVGWVALFD